MHAYKIERPARDTVIARTTNGYLAVAHARNGSMQLRLWQLSCGSQHRQLLAERAVSTWALGESIVCLAAHFAADYELGLAKMLYLDKHEREAAREREYSQQSA
jgi:hypothetical protein